MVVVRVVKFPVLAMMIGGVAVTCRATQRVCFRILVSTGSMRNGNVAVDVLEVVRLDGVGVVEEKREGHGRNGDDHSGDAGIEVEPRELGCCVEGGRVYGTEDPVDDLKFTLFD